MTPPVYWRMKKSMQDGRCCGSHLWKIQSATIIVSSHHAHNIVVQSLSHVQLFASPWTAGHQAPLSCAVSWSLLKIMSMESVTLSNHCILCCPFLLLPSVFPASVSFLMSQLLASGGQSIETFFSYLFLVHL